MQGRIACCNVLSDLYAMGVEDIDQILMVLGVSLKMNEKQREVTTSLLIEGFDDCAKEANTQVVGGQTVYNPWPMIGGAGIAAVDNQEFIMPTQAQPGDIVVMTKALGTQLAVNAKQWLGKEDKTKWNKVKDIVSEEEVNELYNKAENCMCTLNLLGAKLMKKYKARAATDITGFGVLGHATFLAEVQKNKVDIVLHSLAILKNATKVDKVNHNFKLIEGSSAETSGGLLVCLPKDNAEAFVNEVRENGQIANIVGEVVEGNNKARILENVNVIEV